MCSAQNARLTRAVTFAELSGLFERVSGPESLGEHPGWLGISLSGCVKNEGLTQRRKAAKVRKIQGSFVPSCETTEFNSSRKRRCSFLLAADEHAVIPPA